MRLAAILALLLLAAPAAALNDTVVIHFFYSDSCPHCAHEEPFLASLEKEYEWLMVQSYETTDMENSFKYARMAAECDASAQSTPGTIICGSLIVGYDGDEGVGAMIEERAIECHNAILENRTVDFKNVGTEVDIPLLGRMDAAHMSLPILTVVLGFLDGFNPCAFFVLLFLLSLLIHTKSRARMLIIGGIFVFFSGLIYFIFMAAWLNLFLYLGELKMITFAAGIVAIIIGLINIKDFFWFKQGVSLSISEGAIGKLFSRMRGLVKATELPSMIGGTIILAIAANGYELLCTAGFPMVYTRVLTLNQLDTLTYYLYLVAYNVVYIIPLSLIVLFFSVTLGSRKLREREGKMLKLMSGNMMLCLGIMLVYVPGALANVIASISILIFAVVLTVFMMPLAKQKE